MLLKTENVKLKSTDVKRIYFEVFPPKERMPFPLMVVMSKLWNTRFGKNYQYEESAALTGNELMDMTIVTLKEIQR